MKKILILVLFTCLFLTSCNEDGPIIKGHQATHQLSSKPSNTLNQDEAINIAQHFANQISEKSGRSNYRTASRNNTKPIISFSSRATVSDTLMYIVNFENNEGYAIIGAKRNKENLLAIIDKGSYDPLVGSDNPGLNLFFKKAENYITSEENQFEHPESHIVIYHEIRDSIVSRLNPRLEGLAWGQDGIYGQFCPNKIAGCAPVAIGTIMTYFNAVFRGPTLEEFTFENPSIYRFIDWKELFSHKLAYSYPNYENICYESDSELIHEKIGLLLREIGHCCGSTYGNGWTSTSLKNAQSVLKQKLPGYKVGNRAKFDIHNLVYTINNGLAFMVATSKDDNVGHAWVADGFLVYEETVTRKKWSFLNEEYFDLPTLYEKKYLYHFCWGWNGLDDGYYTGAFFSSKDQTTDREPEFSAGGTRFINSEYISICL